MPIDEREFGMPMMRRACGRAFFLFVVGILASISICQAQLENDSSEILAIVGGHLVDVRRGGVTDDSVVLIQRGRITRAGRNGEIPVPSGAATLDARGKWLIPGLTDMHVHISTTRDFSPLLFLANGVTTVRDTGGDITLLRLLKQDLDSGKALGPRLYFSGQILDGNPPVDQNFRILADSDQRAVSAVNFLADQGASFIKVYNNISESVLIATIKTANARGLPVVGHVPRSVTTTQAVELGMACLEHIRITGRELLPKEEADKIDFLTLGRRETLLWQRFDPDSEGIHKLIDVIVRDRVFLDPTLVVDDATFKLTPGEVAAEPNNNLLPKAFLERAVLRGLPDSWKPPAELKEVAAAGFEKRLRFIGLCYHAGVRLLAGTDGPGIGPILPGYGLHSELELLARSGLPPIAALRAATSTAAEAIGVEKDLGGIEPGKRADLVILDTDPLQDIANTRHIYRVIQAGRVYDPQELLAKRVK
jgi:imidazolonepropionase-like amidohydrolase